jgi:hypothetical protein
MGEQRIDVDGPDSSTIPRSRSPRVGSALGFLAVVAAAASTLFAVLPINSTANSYTPEGWIVTAAWLAIGTGLISFAAWMMILARREVSANQMAACGSMALVIVVLAALPALLASEDYAPGAAPSPIVVVAVGLSSITSLIAGSVAYLVVRLLNGRPQGILAGGVAGCVVWLGYALLIRPF